jgi:predicted lipoprotein
MRKILLVLPILLFAACSEQSEAEDAQSANDESVAQFVQAKWDDADERSRDSACMFAHTKGVEFVLDLLAADAEDDSPEFRKALENVVREGCGL